MAATNTAVDDLTFSEGADEVRWWTPVEEPSVAYGSCAQCGSSLFWRTDTRPAHISVTAGPLDPPTGLSTEHALFVAEAGDYHRLDEDLPHHLHDAVDTNRVDGWPCE